MQYLDVSVENLSRVQRPLYRTLEITVGSRSGSSCADYRFDTLLLVQWSLARQSNHEALYTYSFSGTFTVKLMFGRYTWLQKSYLMLSNV